MLQLVPKVQEAYKVYLVTQVPRDPRAGKVLRVSRVLLQTQVCRVLKDF